MRRAYPADAVCPTCRSPIYGLRQVAGAEPIEDDTPVLCTNCHDLLVWRAGGLAQPVGDERAQLAADRDVVWHWAELIAGDLPDLSRLFASVSWPDAGGSSD